MRRLPLLLLLGCLPAGLTLAEGCHVNSRTSSAAVTGIETESCYEFVGMPAEALDWSCSNESKDMTSTRKQRVAQCPGGEQARCDAPLDQESLANPRASARGPDTARPAVPNDARVLTRYYQMTDLGQVRTDCEKSGGRWQEQ
ncbi:hypothetical protein R0G64_10690 [Pseudomonas otitidis]|uniref:Lipoprotein n=2 Tax=Metapseudomonas otitidis TaxID=319939 RepID=A0ABU3XPL5_9GAMM|nr:hypothetical protein [Pseudomonas otitidis]MDV3439892.1 hypothetical protein [Pseudomonas otitidis]